MTRALAAAALVAAAVVLGVVVLGGGGARPAERAHHSLPPVVRLTGAQLQNARCRHWRAGTPADRRAILGVLQGVVGGRTQAGVASTLTRVEATRLFDRACAPAYARGYLLYQLYIRAAGFRSFLPAD